MAGIDDWIDPRAKDFWGLLPPTQSPTIAPPAPPPGQQDYTYTPPVPPQQFLSGIGAVPPPPQVADTATAGPSMPPPQWTATTPTPPPPLTAPVSPPPPTTPIPQTAPPAPDLSAIRPGEDSYQYAKRLNIQNQSDIGSAWDVGVLGMQQLGAGLVAAGGDAVGAEGVRQWGAQKYNELEKEMQPYQEGRITQFEQIKDLGDVGRYAAWSVGQMAPSVVESIGSALVGFAAGTVAAGPVAGAATGLAGALGTSAAKTFVAKRVTEAMAKGAVKEVAEAAANKALAQTVGAGAAMFASSYGMGVGDIYGETMDKDGKGSVGLAALGALPYAALDAFTDLSVFGSILKGTGGDKALARFGKAMLTAGAKEGGAEAGQEAILMLAGAQAGKEYDQATVMSRLGNSFAAAFIGGGVMGIGAGRKGPSNQERDAGTLSALATVGLASAPDSAALHPVLATATASPALRLDAAAKVDAALRASGLEDLADLWMPMAQKAIQAGQPIQPTSVMDVATKGAAAAVAVKQAAMAKGIPEPEAETLRQAKVEQTAKVVTEIADATAHIKLSPEQKRAKIAEIEAARKHAVAVLQPTTTPPPPEVLRREETSQANAEAQPPDAADAAARLREGGQGEERLLKPGAVGPVGPAAQPLGGQNVKQRPPEGDVPGPVGTAGSSADAVAPVEQPDVLASVGVQPEPAPQASPEATGTDVVVSESPSVPPVSGAPVGELEPVPTVPENPAPTPTGHVIETKTEQVDAQAETTKQETPAAGVAANPPGNVQGPEAAKTPAPASGVAGGEVTPKRGREQQSVVKPSFISEAVKTASRGSGNLGDLAKSVAASVKASNDVEIPGNIVSAIISKHISTSKRAINRASGNTNLIGDLLYALAGSAQFKGLVEVPASLSRSGAMVQVRMLGGRKNREVLDSVIKRVPVHVVDMLESAESATNGGLGNQPVNIDLPAVDNDLPVSADSVRPGHEATPNKPTKETLYATDSLRENQGQVRGQVQEGQPKVQPMPEQGGGNREQPAQQGGQAADEAGAVAKKSDQDTLNEVRDQEFPANWENDLFRARTVAGAMIKAGLVSDAMRARFEKRWNDAEDLTDSVKARIAEIEGLVSAPVAEPATLEELSAMLDAAMDDKFGAIEPAEDPGVELPKWRPAMFDMLLREADNPMLFNQRSPEGRSSADIFAMLQSPAERADEDNQAEIRLWADQVTNKIYDDVDQPSLTDSQVGELEQGLEAVKKEIDADEFVERFAADLGRFLAERYGQKALNLKAVRKAQAAERNTEQRSAGEAAASAAGNVAGAFKEAGLALVNLFNPGAGTFSSGLVFNAETYANAKPHFIAMAAHLREAGQDIAAVINAIVDNLKGMGLTREGVENMRPYILRFAQDVQSGAVKIEPGATLKADEKRGPSDVEQTATGDDGAALGEGVPAGAVAGTEQAGGEGGAAVVGAEGEPGVGGLPAGREQPGRVEPAGGGDANQAPVTVGTGTGGPLSGNVRGAEPSVAAEDSTPSGGAEDQATGGAASEGTDGGRGPGGVGVSAPVADGEPTGAGGRGARRRGGDFRAKPDDLTREGSWYDTAERNVGLIELAARITAEKRPATPSEQAQLARYVGFGAGEIRNNLFPVLSKWITDKEPGSLLFPKGVAEFHKYRGKEGEGTRWAALAERLDKLPEAWQRSVLRSTQYAHYTSPGVIGSIWRAMARMGFTGGKLLEPGMGVGHFATMMPQGIYEASHYTGIEFDGPTAAIAKLLLPQQNVLHADFTKRKLPRDFYDAAVGNPPFSNTKVTSDPEYARQELALHDYFFAKTIDRVRPGGLLVFVTSRYTMDKINAKGRRYLAERADLLGAVRLPQTAFRDNAGTDVVTDVLFLRKRMEGEVPAGAAWSELREIESKDKDGKVEGTLKVNEYFADHPEMVLGQTRIGGTGAVDDQGRRINALHPGELVVVSYDTDAGALERRFAQAVERLPENVYSALGQDAAAVQQQTMVKDFDPKEKREGVLYLGDKGAVLRVENGVGVALRDVEKLSDKDEAWLRDYVGLRDAVQTARFAQLEDAEWKPALRKLNALYKAFRETHGPIMDFRLQSRTTQDDDGEPVTTQTRVFKRKRLWRMDYDAPLVLQLEDIREDNSIVKGPFLLDRTVARPLTREIKTPSDALAVSLDAKGSLDLADVAERAGLSQDETIDALGDLVYQTPQGRWQLADEYLSGYVREKLAEAREAAKTDAKFERNVTALEKAIPAPLGPQQIGVQLGAGWVPDRYVSQFARDELGAGAVSYDARSETWTVQGGNKRVERSAAAEWGNADRSPSEILESVLNNRSLVVKKIDDDKKTYTDQQSTAQVNEIARKMRQRFKTWVWTDAKRTQVLLDIYNEQLNNIALRRFDGSHLTLPGVSLRFNMYPHQKRAIWRVIQSGDTYLAHAVGAGKTMEMIAAGMEQRRLGLIRKPMYVVPNHMLEQFSNEFMETYPLANILVADDENFSKERRQQFVAAAAMNNPDAVIITHSAFKRLGVKDETAIPIRNAILDELRDALSDTPADERVRRSQLEKQIEAVEQRFDRIMQRGQDQVIPFEDIGADFLFVDEAHNHRKLDFTTNRKVKGVDPNGSWAAMDLYVKTRYLEGLRPGRAFVMASGTPVTNTVGELYTIQRFFAEDTMRREGMATFDAWANSFGEVATDFERNAAGKLEPVERFAAFSNVPELMNRVRMFMDVLNGSQLGDLVKRPDLEGGKPNMVLVDPTPQLMTYMSEDLNPRLEVSKAWKPSPQQRGNPDPIVAIINDARLASIDMRFVSAKVPANTPSKLMRLADMVAEEYQRTREDTYTDANGNPDKVKGSGQLVFFNLGLGAQVQRNRGFNARKALTDRIVTGGVPKDKIAWIEDANTDAKKEAIFADMRSGKLSVLIGSAKKMGTGVNVQKRLTALQYLDPPWYPADVEQPHGRIIRQGNQNTEVRINWFSTKETYEATMWQMVARKQRFIDQALSGDPSLRRIEDISEASQFEMAAALVSGDPRVLQLAEASRDVERYTRLQEAHGTTQYQLRGKLKSNEWAIKNLRQRIPELEAASKQVGYHQTFANATIVGETFDKRAEAGDALVRAFNAAVASWPKTIGGTIKIGDLNGGKVTLKLQVHVDEKSGKTDGTLIGQVGEVTTTFGWRNAALENKQDNGTHIGAVLTWANTLGRALSNARDNLKETVDEQKAIERRIGAPFEYAAELAEATAKYNQLRQDLMNEGKDVPTDDALDSMAAPGIYVAIDPDGNEQAPRGLSADDIKQLSLHGYKIKPAPVTEDARLVADMDSEGGGQAARFSRQPVVSPLGRVPGGETPTGLSVPQVQGIVDDFGARLLGASKDLVNIRVVARQSDQWGPASRDRDGRVRGAWDPQTKTVILVAENLDSLEQARTVLRHEVVAHYGLTLLSKADRIEFLRRVNEAASQSVALRQIRNEVVRAEGPGADPMVIAEETFARVAESGRSALGAAWDRLLLWLRSKLRDLGIIQGRPNLTEMRVMAADLARGIREGRGNTSELLSGGNLVANPDIRFSFAGERAATADRFALDSAKGRLAAGEDADAVRQNTGWFQGDDGKWRFEISDQDAKLTPNYTDFKGIPAALSDVLAHPALFAAYPEIGNIGTFIEIDPSYHMEGSYNSERKIITVKAPNEKVALSALLHEIQHGIQYVEGFATGGNPNQANPDILMRQADQDLAEITDKIIQNNQDRASATTPELRAQLEGDGKRLRARKERLQLDRGDPYRLQHRWYTGLSGEVEARNVQRRQDMTRAERRAWSPEQSRDVPRADVIVVFNGKEMASAPRPANAAPTLATDLADQSRFLADESKARGFADPDEFLAKDTDGFLALAETWRDGHPREGVGGTLRFSRGPNMPDYANNVYDWFERRKIPDAKNLTGWNRTIGTPFHLAHTKGMELFKAFWEAMTEQRDTRNNIALQAQSWAPNTFADQEHGVWTGLKSATNVARRSSKREEALVQAALNEQVETEDGAMNRSFTDQELRDRGLDDNMIATYRQRLIAAHYALDQGAQSIQVANLRELLKALYSGPLTGSKLTIKMSESARQILGETTTEAKDNAEQMLRPDIDRLDQRIRSANEYLARVREEVASTKKTLNAARAKPPSGDRVTAVKEAERTWNNAKELQAQVEKELADATKTREMIGRFGERDLYGKLMRPGTGTLGDIEGIDEKVQTLKSRSYFPLMRFGKYTLSVYNEDGAAAYFGRFENEDDAKAAELELQPRLTKGQVSKRGVFNESAQDLYNQISMDTLSLFVDYIDTRHNEKAKQQVNLLREYIRIATAEGNALKRQLHREGTPGWSKDSRRVLASYILSSAAMAANNLHAAEVNAKIQAIPAEMGDVQKYAQNLQEYTQNPGEEMAGLRNFMFFWYLGGSLASAAVNLTQIPMVTAPYLTQYGSVAQVTKAIKDAYGMVGKGTMKGNTTALGKSYAKAEHEGYIAPQQIYAMMGTARGGTLGAGKILHHPTTQWLLSLWSTPFAWAEQVNRSVTFIAAYNMAVQSGQNAEVAYDTAVLAVQQTQMVYDKTNRPKWARGNLAPIFTFKTFTIQYLELLFRLPVKQQAIMLGMLFLVAGLGGIPFEEDAEDFLDTIFQVVFGKAWQTHDIGEYLLGETWGKILMEGAPSALGPIDFKRLGQGNIIPGTAFALPGTDTGGQLRAAGEVMGPTSGLIQDAAQAVTKIGRGEFASAAYNAIPKAARNFLDGLNSLRTGVYEDTKGRTVMPVGIADSLFKTIGFQPRSVAEYQNAKWRLQKRAALQRTMEDSFLDRMARARVAGDAEAERAAKKSVDDWNKRNPQDTIAYTRSQIIKRVQAIKAMSRERFLKSMPPELRREAAEATK
jgi:N12 class adenine-specific DNA methylase